MSNEIECGKKMKISHDFLYVHSAKLSALRRLVAMTKAELKHLEAMLEDETSKHEKYIESYNKYSAHL